MGGNVNKQLQILQGLSIGRFKRAFSTFWSNVENVEPVESVQSVRTVRDNRGNRGQNVEKVQNVEILGNFSRMKTYNPWKTYVFYVWA